MKSDAIDAAAQVLREHIPEQGLELVDVDQLARDVLEAAGWKFLATATESSDSPTPQEQQPAEAEAKDTLNIGYADPTNVALVPPEEGGAIKKVIGRIFRL